MTRLAGTFAALQIRNYRLYFTGQIVSVTGTWMQRVAQSWLVLELTGSGTLIGVTAALQFIPFLVAGPWGGLLADRMDKRRLLVGTQAAAGALALILAVLVATGAVRLWMVLVLAFLLGCVGALDNPARQAFVLEMVGPATVANAVTLHSVVVNAARAVGPAVAGILITTVGMAASFAVNAVSYLAVVVALGLMQADELFRAPPTRRAPRQLREGMRYAWQTPALRAPLLLMTVVGMLAYEFQVILPLFARYTFGGDAQTYGIMNSTMGVGAVLGGLLTAARRTPSARRLLRSALVFGGLIVVAATAPTLPFAFVALFGVGTASIAFIATANALLQLRAAPEMRGRVMALWGVAFLGTTPIGGPLVGWVGETIGPRFGLGLGGGATILAAVLTYAYLRRHPANESEQPVAESVQASAIGAAAAGKTAPQPPARGRSERPRRVAPTVVRRALRHVRSDSTRV